MNPIKAVYYIELDNIADVGKPGFIDEATTKVKVTAARHGHEIVGPASVTGGGSEPWLLVWDKVEEQPPF